MTADTLNIVLQLKEENTLYKRAIGDMLFMVATGRPIVVPKYDLQDEDVHLLFRQLYNLLGDKTCQPAKDPDNLIDSRK